MTRRALHALSRTIQGHDGCNGLKLRMLLRFYKLSPLQWWREVWTQDGSQSLCCSGYECGCLGADHASQWEWALSNAPSVFDDPIVNNSVAGSIFVLGLLALVFWKGMVGG